MSIFRLILVGYVWILLVHQDVLGASLNDLVRKKSDAQATTLNTPAAKQAVSLPRATILRLITEKIHKTTGQDVSLRLGSTPPQVMCTKASNGMLVERVTLNKTQTKFSAELRVCDTEPSLIIAGHLDLLTTVPALSHAIHFGESITAKDISSLQV